MATVAMPGPITRNFGANESVDGKADSWSDPLRGNFNQLRKLKLANPR